MFSELHLKSAAAILQQCRQKGLWLTTAESCTGGLIAALLTETAGASSMFERGFVTYSNEAKADMLGVDKALLEKYGAVSSQVAVAMAEGALKNSKSDVSVSITGIAGPDGGSTAKPVGLVFIAVATNEKIIFTENLFTGTRSDIRMQSVAKAVEMLDKEISSLRA